MMGFLRESGIEMEPRRCTKFTENNRVSRSRVLIVANSASITGSRKRCYTVSSLIWENVRMLTNSRSHPHHDP